MNVPQNERGYKMNQETGNTHTPAIIAGFVMAFIFACILSSCSFKVETGWHGTTGRDDRVISPGLYPENVSQMRDTKQRY